jgi:DNA-binding response OmpR family regulator
MSRVLVVDDSPSIRLLLVRRLEMAGHETTEAADGERALNALAGAGGPAPELVLLDAMLPDAQGAGLLDTIRERSPGTPVLVVSAVSELANDPDWSGADGYVGKPIDFDDLLRRVEALTSGPPRP